MANRSLFQSNRGALLPEADARNDAGAPAYGLSPKAALAQLAATGCLNGTFYAEAGDQLDRVLDLANRVEARFVAKTALYARRRGFMKDMPALLCAVLARRDLGLLAAVFPEVIDNGRMLRNFVQIVRSGVTGRKSLGTAPKRLLLEWLERAGERKLLQASIGADPSLADIVKMVHPRPADPAREAFYAWLLGKAHDPESLPESLRAYEAWKRDRTGELPEVPFRYLTSLPLETEHWELIARRATWQETRMNLNAFARHGVFRSPALVRELARRLADPKQVRRARAFPYQLLVAFLNASDSVPDTLRNALQDAMETALTNVPAIEGRVVVCPDVSGSMHWPVTGWRPGATSRVRCVDVAALVTAALLRRNRDALVLPFAEDVVPLRLNPRDSVMTNATRLASLPPGATRCSAPLRQLNRTKARADLVVFVSDNESWVDARRGATATLREWERFRILNPKARMVCIDLVPNTTSQAPGREDILNVGGFSDAVFKLLAAFARGDDGTSHWIAEIEKEPIPLPDH